MSVPASASGSAPPGAASAGIAFSKPPLASPQPATGGNRHSRKLTLRAAVALLDRLDRMGVETMTAVDDAGSFSSGPKATATGDDSGGAVGLKAGGGGPSVSKKSITSVIKALVQKVMDLKTENESWKAKYLESHSQVTALSSQVELAMAQVSSAYERLDALQVEHTRLQVELAEVVESTTGIARVPQPAIPLGVTTPPRASNVEPTGTPVDAAVDVSATAGDSRPQPSPAFSAPSEAAHGAVQQQVRMANHVHTMAKQLTETSGHLKKERTARKAMATAYKELFASHVRMLAASGPSSQLPTNTSALDEADPVVSSAVAAITAWTEPLAEDADAGADGDIATAPTSVADHTATASATPAGDAATGTGGESVGAASIPANRRRSWLLDEPLAVPAWLPGLPPLPISSELMKELSSPQLQSLVSALREHAAVAREISRPEQQADEGMPTSHAAIENGMDATLLQRLVDTVDSACAFARVLEPAARSFSAQPTAIGRAERRLARALQPLPPSTLEVALAPETVNSSDAASFPHALVQLSTRIVLLFTAMQRVNAAGTASGGASATGSFLQVVRGCIDDLVRGLVPVSSLLMTLLLTTARRIGTAASLEALISTDLAEISSRVASHAPPSPRGEAADTSSTGGADTDAPGHELVERPPDERAMQSGNEITSGDDAQLMHPLLIGEKTKLEWFADQLFASVSTASWQPHATVGGKDDVCGLCNTAFGMFNRRHHCRCCGDVVCQPCSRRWVVLSDYHVPVATICDDEDRAADSSAMPPPSAIRRRRSSLTAAGRLVSSATDVAVHSFHECVTAGPQRVCDECHLMLSTFRPTRAKTAASK